MARMRSIAALGSLWTVVKAVAPTGPWDTFNLAPSSKTVRPVAIHGTFGSVSDASALLDADGTDVATLQNNGSWITLDFGKEVGGLITLNIASSSSTSTPLALAFTESPWFIRPEASDDSPFPDSTTKYDGVELLSLTSSDAVFDTGASLNSADPNFGSDPFALSVPAAKAAKRKRQTAGTITWTQPASALRGGFRYLTLSSISSEPVQLSNVTCAISFSPHIEDLRAYTGYFSTSVPATLQTGLTNQGFAADPDFLTKLWYAGAYTVQTNAVDAHAGRQFPFIASPGWDNNAQIGLSSPVIVDGAKRDRNIWPGDMGIAVPTAFVSTNDLISTRNSLSTLFAFIDPVTGALPFAGPPLLATGSDTYHAWTLIGVHNYWLYSGDVAWVDNLWANYTKAVAFLEDKVDSSNLMNVTGVQDWARLGMGGYNSEANALLYKVLLNSVDLANAVNVSGASSLASAWSTNATSLKSAYNTLLWDASQGLYTDNSTTKLCPQDGNSLAVLFNLTDTPDKPALVSQGLQKNWNERGPVTPELPDTISPFVSGFELQAHFVAGNDSAAMELMHREWGYMLYTNLSVQSTLVEGFTANGSLGYRSAAGYSFDPSYTSHSHGWSTGPTSALTYYVVGLQVTSAMGKTWSLFPHTSGLSSAQGGLETALGRFDVNWTIANGTVTINYDVPQGTNGTVGLPTEITNGTTPSGESLIVQVDGADVEAEDGVVQVSGGNYTVTARLGANARPAKHSGSSAHLLASSYATTVFLGCYTLLYSIYMV